MQPTEPSPQALLKVVPGVAYRMALLVAIRLLIAGRRSGARAADPAQH